MRRKFSERYGFLKLKDVFQIQSIDNDLKNRLWNQIQEYYFDSIEVDLDISISPYDVKRYIGGTSRIIVKGQSFNQIEKDEDYHFFRKIYDAFFKMNVKPSSFLNDININIQERYNAMQWYEIYDFIEYISEIYPIEKRNINFKKSINEVLKSEMSAYRFVDNYITPIIDEVEIQEVEEALEIEYNGAKRHLSNALELLSDRENPDYPNSIKESISAVEAVAKEITGKDTDLSKCLKAMDLDLNKQFKTAMDNMYGWTCKEDGIRHGHTGEELKTSFEEAKYMLVTCSAFVNYMIAKKGQK